MIEKSLHSRYNPRGEAERYIASLNLGDDLRYIILIEPGLGYCIPPLKKRCPLAKIIALHLSGAAYIPGAEAHARWNSGSDGPLQEFLEKEIPETGGKTIKLVEWRPALGFYGEKYLKIVAECAEFIKRIAAGDRTVKQFGRRWFRNFFRNIALIQKSPIFDPIEGPLLIAGAGPSLEDAIPLIRENREKLFVLAVSSATAALAAAGIVPDLIISTDGGNWALLHLYECGRCGDTRGKKPPLAAGLSAALPSQCSDIPLLFISDGSLWQSIILKGLGIPFISLPQRGTVSAAALDLAMAISRGKIFFTGIDLSHRDIRTHARPYAFDRLWEQEASRLNPVYHHHFERSAAINAGGSQAIYAAWFRQQIAGWPRRIFSLGGNNQVFKGLEAADGLIEYSAAKKTHMKDIALNFPKDPKNAAVEILRRALEAPRAPDSGETRLREELIPLLCPDNKEISAAALIDWGLYSGAYPGVHNG
ncbi:hypothetical protein AGMMS49928_01580 [Spirochaetia bacterium]|nr:hypothetical protein AGMMS49928_01580 [Spirochaetia bacterium]